MSKILAILTLIYLFVALGNYHEPTVVSPMEALVAISLLPAWLCSCILCWFGFYRFMGTDKKDEKRNDYLLTLVLSLPLLIYGIYALFFRKMY